VNKTICDINRKRSHRKGRLAAVRGMTDPRGS